MHSGLLVPNMLSRASLLGNRPPWKGASVLLLHSSSSHPADGVQRHRAKIVSLQRGCVFTTCQQNGQVCLAGQNWSSVGWLG